MNTPVGRGTRLSSPSSRPVGRDPRAHRGTAGRPLSAGGFALLSLALAALVFLTPACGRRDVGPGGLKVLLALPRGAAEAPTSVDVSFDHPMVAVGATTGPGLRAPLRLTPRVPGRFRWIGTRTASFVPEAPLPAATRFRVTVPAGTRSVDGRSLTEEFSWEFSTPGPALTRSFPARRDLHEEDGGGAFTTVTPDVEILLEFNQPVNPVVVERAAFLREDRPGGPTISLRGGRPTRKHQQLFGRWAEPGVPDNQVVLVPAKMLPKDSHWILTLDAGLKGTSGPLPMGTAVTIPFRTCGPFRIESVRETDARERSIRLKISNPVDDDSLAVHLRFDPPVKIRGVWSWGDEQTNVLGTFEAGRTYRLTVTPGLRDLYGNALDPAAAVRTFTMGDYPPAAGILPASGVLERGREPRFAVLLTNVEKALLEMKAVGPEAVPRLEGDEEYPGRRAALGRPTQKPLWPMEGEKSRTLVRRTPRNVVDTVYVGVEEALGPGGAGMFALQVTSLDPGPVEDPGYKLAPRPRDGALLRVTDIGLTAKTAPAGHLVWATSLATGEALAGVDLELRNAFGAVLWRGVTDSRGLATGPGTGGSPGTLRIFARRGSDTTFLTLGRDWSLESWAFDIPGGGEEAGRDLDGMIYGDRNLYRPGETVHLKGILRERISTGLRVPAGITPHLQITDPRGRALLDSLLAFSRFGTVALDFPLPAGARPGGYQVRLCPDRGGRPQAWSFQDQFEVAEYRAPEFEVKLTTARPGIIAGQNIEARVAAATFFGAPLAGGSVKWTLGRHPADFIPPGCDGYSFGDPDRPEDYEMVIGDGAGKLDADGSLALTPRADLGGLPASMRYDIEAEVTDLTGQSSSAAASVVVHRGLVYPGVKAGRALVKAGQKVPVDVILVTPEGKPAPAVGPARVLLVRREWRTARRLLVGGAIGGETSQVDTTLESRPLPGGSGARRLEFAPPSAGCYRVIVEAADAAGNRQRSVATFYASGPGEFGWGWDPGPRIELVTDRKDYAPGDTARILVRSPFREALGLVTVERETVREAWTRRFTGTSEMLEIPIPRQGGAPNLYVSVALVTGSNVRAGADARLAKPEFRLGIATLPIDYRDKVLSVAVAPARAEAAPGDSLRVSVRLTDRAGRGVPGEVSLAVVDEAVLALLGTGTPDPVARFYAPRPLSVRTSELRRLVQLAPHPGEKGEEPGGGGGEGEGIRSRFATTAAWLPGVVTDGSGRAEVGFRLPDNLTRFRIMAVAADAGERFGSADTSITVTKPLLVQAALPRFASAGDQFRAGAVIHNRTDRPLTVEVSAEVKGLLLRSSPSVRLPVPAHDSRRADFGVAVPAPGTARVLLRARAGGASDAVEISFPVVRPAAWRTEATAGLAGGPVEEKVTLPAAALPDSARIDLEMAPSLLGGLTAAFEYLRTYPYGCLEQVGSGLWARLLETRLSTRAAQRAAGDQALARLAAYRQEDGGFSLWPGEADASSWATAYALLILAEAGRVGAPVGEMASGAAAWLDGQLRVTGRDTVATVKEAPGRAMSLWALGESGIPEQGGNTRGAALELLTALRAQLSKSTRLHLALAWQGRPGGAGAQRAILDELDNNAEQAADLAWLSDRCSDPWERGWYSPTRVTGLFLAASIRSGRRSPLEPKVVRWLMERRKNGRWESTQANIAALLGLFAWRDVNEGAVPDLTVRASCAGRAAPAVRFTALDQPPARASWPAPAAGNSVPLRIERDGRGLLYYTASLHYLEPTVGRPALETGLTLARSWEVFRPAGVAAPAGPPPPIRSGDLVVVTLTLVLPEEADFLVLADPLPAGLEPVQLGFRTTSRVARRAMGEGSGYVPGHGGLPVDYSEQRDREVRVFVDHASPGVYEYRYLARAVTAGRFAAAAARAELMYHPEVIALTDGPWFEVKTP